MTPRAYYNEIDPYAAQWLRNLISAGHIAPGDVDERSIEDVRPDDLRGYVQCHFFAGIGVWSHALRRAGVADSARVWTGSCPCQPFSAAGKGDGFADERHLWPAWLHLISQCEPERVYGEQVASRDADPWIDLVQADLEALDYAVGAVPFPSAGVGAPHIRDRLYWVADADDARLEGWCERASERAAERAAGTRGSAGWLANADHERRIGLDALLLGQERGRVEQDRVQAARGSEAGGVAESDGECARGHTEAVSPRQSELGGLRRPCGLADTNGGHASSQREQRSGQHGQQPQDGGLGEGQPGPTNGIWRAADWVLCRPEPGFPDGRWRPVEPGTFPLAHGAAARVGRLRAYGNAINAEAATQFVRATL